MTLRSHDYQLVAVTTSVTVATIALLCSALTLLLIKRLPKLNGYMKLVLSLSRCQVLYDFSFFFFLDYNSTFGKSMFTLLNTWGGLTTSLWSNVIILVTCYIVLNLRSVNISDKVSSTSYEHHAPFNFYLAYILLLDCNAACHDSIWPHSHIF
jgi:hypothetical protein